MLHPPSDPASRFDLPPGERWDEIEQEPTNLLVFWPYDEAPTVVEVIASLGRAPGERVEDHEEFDDGCPDCTWCAAVRFAGRATPVMVWTQAAVGALPPEIASTISHQPRWVIGVESMLCVKDPLADFLRLIRMARSAAPETPAVLDVNTANWYPRGAMEKLARPDGIEPPVEVLWTIHAVVPDEASTDPAGPTWLHTHGLWRCGLPELEMIEVPATYQSAACALINDVAALMLEQAAPPQPAQGVEIGLNLRVALVPWREAASCVGRGVPGGMGDRRDDPENAHIGARAVVCDAVPAGAFRKVWVWPREALDRLREDEAAVYRTQRATERQARLAQAGWSQLAMAFAALTPKRECCQARTVVFSVKVGFEAECDPGNREHLWFDVRAFDGDAAIGELMNQPFRIKGLERGATLRLQRERVSDWIVFTPSGTFGPDDVEGLWHTVDALRRERTV